ncbi:MAG TPA: hypothetical protein PKA37_02180 [Planctomycetota bacterium]|jgi:ABC-type transport system involved in multi-copper enzyme maturation permease subunit|nr:hypothetical protein [Planctomycetota bacterium]
MKLRILIALLSGGVWGSLSSVPLEARSPGLILVGVPFGLLAALLIEMFRPRGLSAVYMVALVTLVMCGGLFCTTCVFLRLVPHFGDVAGDGGRPLSSMVYASQQSGRMVWHMVSTPWIFLAWPLAIFNHLIYIRFSNPLPPVKAHAS